MHIIFSNDQMEPPSPSPSKPSASNFWLTAQTNIQLKQRALPIQPIARSAHFPLSFNQERLWLLEQLQPGRSVYNLLHTFHLQGTLNVAALEQSLSELTHRHEILRTCFSTVAGQPVQTIAPAIPLHLPVHDLQALSPAEQATTVQQIALQDADHPFDLQCAPLWRFQLLRLAPDDHVLIRTIHHLIFDGMSHSVFLRELGLLYSAFAASDPSPLSALPIQYADFAYTQRQWFQAGVFSHQIDYWQQTLSHHPTAIILPIDRPRPALPDYQGSCHSFTITEDLTEALKAFSVQQGVSLFVTLLTAFQTLLYCYSQQEDMLICSPVASRHYAGTRGLIGYFNNLVVTRTDLSGNPSFRDLLNRVSQVSLATSANQDIP
ncbi:MAG TPA: condensation domain-containing protein, partial [Allocoleopsis sp.]